MKKIYVCLLLLILAACYEENIVINQPDDQVIKTNKMIALNAYEGNTAAMIKARAHVPRQADMIINGTTVECYNVDVDYIADVIGSSNTDIGGLCSSPNVNQFANFSPVDLIRQSDGLVARQVKTPYSLDAFAGYNHLAYPTTYFYSKAQTTFNIAKNESNQFAFGFYLSRGEKPPVSRSGYPCSWNYTKLKIVITDLTNNRTLTGYSAVQAVPTSTLTSPYSVVFTDPLGGGAFTGSATVTLVYTDSTGTHEYGYGEDIYPAIALSVSTAQPIPLSASDFSVTLPTIYWYYVKNNVSPYNELVYANYPHKAHSSYSDLTGELVTAYTFDPLGMRVPPTYPGQTWPLAMAVIVSNGIYRLYSITEAAGGGNIIANRSIPSSFAYGYKLTYVKDLSRLPLTASEF